MANDILPFNPLTTFTNPNPPFVSLGAAAIQYFSVKAEDKDTPLIASNYLGNPIFSNLKFLPDSLSATGDLTAEELVINTVLFTVNMHRNIVKTAVQGRDGTIKEYISNGDYEININGLIVSEQPLKFPKTDVQKLRAFLTLPRQIAVASSFLQLFSVNSIVVEDFNISEKMGSRNEVLFSIFAISDVAKEVDLSNVTAFQ